MTANSKPQSGHVFDNATPEQLDHAGYTHSAAAKRANTKPLDLAQFEGHTPGPWNTHDRSEITHGYHSWHCASESGRTIAVLTHTKTVIPDAALIAAAPAMLAECKRQREQIQALREALASVLPDLQYGTTGRWKGEGSASLVAALKVSP